MTTNSNFINLELLLFQCIDPLTPQFRDPYSNECRDPATLFCVVIDAEPNRSQYCA